MASIKTYLKKIADKTDDGNQIVQFKSNTAKDGSGTSYFPLVDSDGHLQVDIVSGGGGGGGGGGDASAANQSTQITHLSEIEGAVETIEACVGSNKLNVNISSGGFDGVVSGTVTANLSATDNAVLDAIATDGDNIQTLLTCKCRSRRK